MSTIDNQPQRYTHSPDARAKMIAGLRAAWRRGRPPGGNGAGKFERLTDEQRADIAARYANFETTKEIGAIYRVSNTSVGKWLHRMGVPLRKPSRVSRVAIPAWVPRDLHKKFYRIAIDSDEIDAAAWARAQKRKIEGAR